MMSDIIIRNIKLSILTDNELEEPYRSIHRDLDKIFKNTRKYKSKFIHENYYGSSKYYLYLRSKQNNLWICKNKISDKFLDKYDIGLESIYGLITFYFENYFDIQVNKCFTWSNSDNEKSDIR